MGKSGIRYVLQYLLVIVQLDNCLLYLYFSFLYNKHRNKWLDKMNKLKL